MTPRNILKLLIVVAILAAIACGIWWWQNKKAIEKMPVVQEAKGDWMQYVDAVHSFSFVYPRDLLPLQKTDRNGETYFASIGEYDTLSANVVPARTADMNSDFIDEGEVEAGGRTWRVLNMGDAGCGSVRYYSDFQEGEEILVWFSSCESAEMRDWLTTDTEIHKQILSSFIWEEESKKTSECIPAGCSGQLCVSKDEAGDIFTTCEYRAEYACYENAKCEPQVSGECGWTQTAQLKACLQDPPLLQ